jgi:hypothetical protein
LTRLQAGSAAAADAEKLLDGLSEKQRRELATMLLQVTANLGLPLGVHPAMQLDSPPYRS